MKILLLGPSTTYAETLQEFACLRGDVTVITGEQVDNYSSDSSIIDIIVGSGDFTNGSKVTDQLLAWRTHPYTYLVPCWIISDQEPFTRVCLWPGLSIDRFSPQLLDHEFCSWLTDVAEWQQTRMHLEACNTFQHHSCLELVTSLALRKASGRLTVFDEEGGEGYLLFRSGCFAEGLVKHINGPEAFFEFLTWHHGSYCWEISESSLPQEEDLPVDLLIQDGLRLLREANLLYHFMPDLHQLLHRTESQSALHDGAAPFFAARKEIYYLIDGSVSAARLVEASPLSRPRTMSILAQWFSLDDISLASTAASEPASLEVQAEAEAHDAYVSLVEASVVLDEKQNLEATLQAQVDVDTASEEHPVEQQYPSTRHRLLIVDDSALMCRALRDIFSKDPRFEIVGVAHDGVEALAVLEKLKPDVLTLDIQMPRMDGLTTLKHIMIRDPRPVVILSAFTKETSQLTYESFKYGAVDVCTKPVKGQLQDMEAQQLDLRDRVAQAAVVHLDAAQYIRRGRKPSVSSSEAVDSLISSADGAVSAPRLVIIGCGAGGFPSLLKLMFAFSWDDPMSSTIACMAMPGRVIDALLPNLVKDTVRRLEPLAHGLLLESGVCYMYSNDFCFRLLNEAPRIRVEEDDQGCENLGPMDYLFSAAAESFGDRVTACILAGVGEDGLAGLQAVKQRGGRTYVLTPQACLKPDLPRRVLELGDAEEVQTVGEMARLLWGSK